MFIAKFVLFHIGSTEVRRCENCVFFLPVNVVRQLLGPHDTLPCVLIGFFVNDIYKVQTKGAGTAVIQ